MFIFDKSKPVMTKIQVAVGDAPLTLSSSDYMAKSSDILDTASAYSNAHDTLSPMVHAINIQSRRSQG